MSTGAPSVGRGLARAAVSFAALASATVVALLPLCDLLFDCGCTWPWAGGVEHCNVFHARGPRCPWCVHPWTADASLGTILAAEGLGAWVAARRTTKVGWLVVAGALAGAAAALGVRSLVAGWFGYPL